MISLLVYSPETQVLLILPQIAVVAILSTIAELLSIGWTDNFLIPIITSILMWQMLFPLMPLLPLPVI